MRNVSTIKEILTAATFEVFEKMYYIFSEPAYTEGGDYYLKSSIQFIGPSNGEVQLLLSRGVSEAMAENMLGLDQNEITRAILADCGKECINMICGAFLRGLDSEKPFHLSSPSVEEFSEDLHQGQPKQPPAVCLRLSAKEGNVGVELICSDIQ